MAPMAVAVPLIMVRHVAVSTDRPSYRADSRNYHWINQSSIESGLSFGSFPNTETKKEDREKRAAS